MIERTFQFIPGVGPWRERDLWARGVSDWDAFEAASGTILSKAKDPVARAWIAKARQARMEGDLAALGAMLPGREHWRLYRAFADRAVFFDIETDGSDEQLPTAVSLFDRDGLHVFVRGQNLSGLPAALAKRSIWVTFNGSCFDVPVLRRHFPRLVSPELHLDLRFIGRRVGLSGGLKQIEGEVGVTRPTHLEGLGGLDAVLLWRAYEETGDPALLRVLVEYNLYDAFNLRALMELIFNRAVDGLAFDDEPRLPPFDPTPWLGEAAHILQGIDARGPQDPRLLARVRERYGG